MQRLFQPFDLTEKNKQRTIGCQNAKQHFEFTTQYAEAVFNKMSGSRNKTYPGLISMHLGFKKCIA